MPHGSSWFHFLPFLKSLEHGISESFGPSWIAGSAHIRMGHVVAFAAVILFVILSGVLMRTKFGNPEEHLLPEGKLSFTAFLEAIVSAVYGMLVDLMDEKAAKHFLPLIGTCAFVIFFSNALGLIPGFSPPTDNLNTNAAMAIVIFVATHAYGVKEHGFVAYMRHFFGPKVPLWLAWFVNPLIFVIELISHVVRPVTLSIRLMANMMADHLVLGIFIGLFTSMVVGGVSLFWVPVPVVMYLLGTIVVTVQTLVFCLLSAIYIALAIEHHEEEH